MKVYINPVFNMPDRGEGGIRRVVEAQKRWLPRYGIDVVDDIKQADLCAFHAGAWVEPPKNIPVVTHTHGLYWEEYYGWSKGHAAINKDVIRNLKQADVVTAPSEWVAYSIKRGMWLDPIVLYHGIEPDEWPLSEEHDDYVLWNKTRIDPICDPTPLDELVRRAPDIKFVSTFGRPAPNLTLTGNETYERAKEYVARAGVYLCTARETFGIGTLEAMAAGVPVLGFNYGGQREIVVHKEQGYLAEPDNYDDLAVGLDYCREHREFLGRNARQKVLEQFTWQYWIGKYADLYRETIIQSRRRPKVSIIIPYYNLPQYVGEAVTSAKEQLAKANIKGELIIVDDASTEPLPPEVSSDPEVYVHTNRTNKDLPETINLGTALANGEYVLYLDADNRLANLDALVNALDADRSLDVAYGRMRVFSEAKPDGWVSTWPPPEALLQEQLKHKNQIPSTALYRKRIFTWVGGYRHRCYTAEDADFWTRVLAIGAKAKRVTDLVTLEYRDRNDSRSHQRKDWLWNDWYTWAEGRYRLVGAGGPIFIHDNPEISVVIPVGLGHEKLLLDALDSVQAQSSNFYNWEAVVVNDTGRSLNAPSWARVIPAPGGGVSAARNRGMLLSKGKFVVFLDADDYLHPQALYHLYNQHLTSSCNKTFVYSDWFEAETGVPHKVADFVPEDVLGRLPYPVTCLYKRDDLLRNNISWDESFKEGWEDWDFALQVVTAGFCGLHIPAPLLHYRLGTGTLRLKAKAHGDEIKRKVRFKYSEYFKGDKTMPGCGGCGGGRYPSITSPYTSTSIFDNVDLDQDTSMIEYNPPPDWTGTRTFVGRGTGNRYRFSTDEANRVRRVFNSDVEGLLAIGYFAKLDGAVGTLAPLQATGTNDVPTSEGVTSA